LPVREWARRQHGGAPVSFSGGALAAVHAIITLRAAEEPRAATMTSSPSHPMTASRLERAWLDAWGALGATPPTGLFDALLARWQEPQRHYHTSAVFRSSWHKNARLLARLFVANARNSLLWLRFAP